MSYMQPFSALERGGPLQHMDGAEVPNKRLRRGAGQDTGYGTDFPDRSGIRSEQNWSSGTQT